MRRQSRPISGFTLVELLVVIAIIGVLIALLLPAVQQAREAARRTQCVNQQKQLALAFHNYQSALLYFPHGFVGESATTTPTMRRDCWFQRILPYLEQSALYDALEAENPTYIHQSPAAIKGHPVESMTCPSDPNSPSTGGGGDLVGFQGNYVVSHGPGRYSVGSTPAAGTITITDGNIATWWDTQGMFFRESHLSFRDCTDGTSHTLIASEGITRPNGDGVTAPWGEAGGYWGGSTHGAAAFSVGEPPNTSVPDRCYSCKQTSVPGAPSNAQCENQNADGLIGRWNYARSYHPGGVVAALLDGSVRFVPNTIDRQTWLRMGIRSDGLVAGDY